MRKSGKWATICLYGMICLVISCFFVSYATAQDKVVVIPLMEKCITCKGTLVGTRWCDNGDDTVTEMTTTRPCMVKTCGLGESKPWRSNIPDNHDDAHTRAGFLHDGNGKIWSSIG